MRNAHRGLTVRGRAFLAAGITTVACSMLFRMPGLAAVGLLLIALPTLTVLWLGSARQQLSLTRSVSNAVVPVGQSSEVTLTLRNNGSMLRGTLLLEDRVSFALGARPRFVIGVLDRHAPRSVDYQIRSEVRGHFTVGPLTLRICDGLGMVEMTRSFTNTASLIVTPRPLPLPGIPLRSQVSGSGESRPRAFAVGSAEDVTVRDYRRGDDLRRVHWRSTARVGELMVRREERPWQARATVLLDNRVDSHQGQGAASSLEIAVTAAASVASHLIRAGFSTRLATAAGVSGGTGFNDPSDGDVAVLEALAMVPQVRVNQFDLSWLGDIDSGGLVVAVLGSLTSADLTQLRRVAGHCGTCVALVVDAGSPIDEVTRGLASIGWRATGVERIDLLPSAWRGLGGSSLTRRIG